MVRTVKAKASESDSEGGTTVISSDNKSKDASESESETTETSSEEYANALMDLKRRYEAHRRRKKKRGTVRGRVGPKHKQKNHTRKDVVRRGPG